MTSAPLSQPRFRASRALRAVIFGLAVGISAPLLAETLADVQRLKKQSVEKVGREDRVIHSSVYPP